VRRRARCEVRFTGSSLRCGCDRTAGKRVPLGSEVPVSGDLSAGSSRDGVLVRVELDGHPSVNPIIIADDRKDQSNAGHPADDGRELLEPLSELPEGHGYSHDEATAAARTLLPDILSYDRTRPAAYPNGSAMTGDVLSARAAYATHRQSTAQGLKRHDDLMAEFPFLGLPNP
jgi:hypothetical protein